jgi:hypothetical protein
MGGGAKGASTSGEPSVCSDADAARGPPQGAARPAGGESANVDRRAACFGMSKVRIVQGAFQKAAEDTQMTMWAHSAGSLGEASRCSAMREQLPLAQTKRAAGCDEMALDCSSACTGIHVA